MIAWGSLGQNLMATCEPEQQMGTVSLIFDALPQSVAARHSDRTFSPVALSTASWTNPAYQLLILLVRASDGHNLAHSLILS